MAVDTIKALGSIDPRAAHGAVPVAPATGGGGFQEQFLKALEKVDSLQQVSNDTLDGMISGRVTETHDVMIAARESQLAFELLLEVRNKLLESYQEIMRTQV
ncbi:MAG: flagellar hook-basal body complex protein FliE [bacterium]|nr:flagellar hook-basal body complex protein FliE [bacterium]